MGRLSVLEEFDQQGEQKASRLSVMEEFDRKPTPKAKKKARPAPRKGIARRAVDAVLGAADWSTENIAEPILGANAANNEKWFDRAGIDTKPKPTKADLSNLPLTAEEEARGILPPPALGFGLTPTAKNAVRDIENTAQGLVDQIPPAVRMVTHAAKSFLPRVTPKARSKYIEESKQTRADAEQITEGGKDLLSFAPFLVQHAPTAVTNFPATTGMLALGARDAVRAGVKHSNRALPKGSALPGIGEIHDLGKRGFSLIVDADLKTVTTLNAKGQTVRIPARKFKGNLVEQAPQPAQPAPVEAPVASPLDHPEVQDALRGELQALVDSGVTDPAITGKLAELKGETAPVEAPSVENPASAPAIAADGPVPESASVGAPPTRTPVLPKGFAEGEQVTVNGSTDSYTVIPHERMQGFPDEFVRLRTPAGGEIVMNRALVARNPAQPAPVEAAPVESPVLPNTPDPTPLPTTPDVQGVKTQPVERPAPEPVVEGASTPAPEAAPVMPARDPFKVAPTEPLPTMTDGGVPTPPEPPKPVAPKPETAPPNPETTTGAKNAITELEREQRGLSPVEKQEYQTLGKAYDAGQKAVTEGKTDPRQIAREVADTPRPLTADEVGSLAYDRMRIKNALKDTRAEAEAAIQAGDDAGLNGARERIRTLEDAFDANDQALQKGGREQSAAFNARKLIVKEDYSLEAVLQKARIKKGGALDAKETAKWTQKVKDLEEAKAKADTRVAELEAQVEAQQKSAAEAVSGPTRRLAKRSGKRITDPASPDFTFEGNTVFVNGDEALARLKEKWANAPSVKDVLGNKKGAASLEGLSKEAWKEAVADVTEVVGAYIEKGVRWSYKKFVLHLRKTFPGLPDGVIREGWAAAANDKRLAAVVAGDKRKITISREEIASGKPVPEIPKITRTKEAATVRKTLTDLKADLAKLDKSATRKLSPQQKAVITRLKDQIAAMEGALKAGTDLPKKARALGTPATPQMVKLRARAAELRTQLAEAKKLRNPTDPQVAIRKRLETELGAVEDQIKAGKRNPKPTPTPLSPENAAIKQKLTDLRAKLAEIDKVANPTDQQAAMRRRLTTEIAKYGKALKEGKRLPERAAPTVPNAENATLQGQLAALKEQYNQINQKPKLDNRQAIQKRLLRKRIAEIENALATNQDLPGKRAPITPDAEAVSLREQYGVLKAIYDELHGLSKNDKRMAQLQKRMNMIEEAISKREPLPKRDPVKYSKEVMDLQDQVKRKKAELDAALAPPATMLQKIGRQIVDLANVPRTLMTSFDFSAPLRQGILMIGEGKTWTNAFAKMFNVAFSEGNFRAMDDMIRENPHYPLAEKSGLYIAPIEETARLAAREEAFMSKIAGKIPGIRMSERAYVGFLNNLRAETFYKYAKLYDGIATPAEFAELAQNINVLTGRGPLGAFDRAGAQLANVFFSPRMMTARLLTPLTLAKSSPMARAMALKNLTAFTVLTTTTLGLLKAGGAEVETDPRSSDFGKAKIGNTRLDFTGGLSPYVRYTAQLITGQRKDTRTGRVKEAPRTSVLGSFARSKLSPTAGIGMNLLSGKDFTGADYEPKDLITWKSLMKNLTPMNIQDAVEAGQQEGIGMGALAYTLSSFGVGANTYDAGERRRRPRTLGRRANR